MSRRRPTTPAPLARRADGRDKGIFRAERHAAVDVIDPGGHRLVRFVRYLWETGPESCEIDPETIAPGVDFREQTDDDGNLLVLWFGCKVCRDQGRPVYSSVPYPRVLDASLCGADLPPPRRRGRPRTRCETCSPPRRRGRPRTRCETCSPPRLQNRRKSVAA